VPARGKIANDDLLLTYIKASSRRRVPLLPKWQTGGRPPTKNVNPDAVQLGWPALRWREASMSTSRQVVAVGQARRQGEAMRRSWTWVRGLLLGAALVLAGPSAFAVITRLTPLSEILKDQQYICLARVDKLDPQKPAVVLSVAEDFKGKLPYRRLPVNLKGDSEARKHDHVAQLLKRLAPDLPVILFANPRGKRLTVFAFSNGTWFQLIGQQVPERKDAVVLGFTHCEPFLRRTFKGTTAELRQVIADGLSGKRKPPAPDIKEPPGLGPEIRSTKSEIRNPRFLVPTLRVGTQVAAAPRPERQLGRERVLAVSGRDAERPFLAFTRGAWEREDLLRCPPAIAVIPTIGLGAPLALLALLFPSLFGGVALLFRRWTAFFTVLSVVSLVYLLHGFFAKSIRGTWLSTQAGIWLVMTFITLAGVLWAWRRQVNYLQEGPATAEVPRRTELMVLWTLSLSFLAAIGLYWLFSTPGGTDPVWNLLLVGSAGLWAGTAYKVYRALRFPQAPARSEIATEGVILWTCLAGFVAFAVPATSGTMLSQADPETITSDAGQPGAPAGPKFLKAEGMVLLSKGNGLVVSTPWVVGDRAYVSVAHKTGLDTFGAIYCLDAKAQKILWAQDDDGGMKQMFSSPCVADGRLYVGEGFHDDTDCKLYCLDARTGKKLWDFPTSSQTESSPCVAGGRVFFGAGNDGVFALDAASGKKVWQFQSDKGRLLRVGAGPAVAGKRLYVGSGVDRNSPNDPGETAVFCLDADNGKLVWKVPVDLPAWGAPAVAGDRVYFGLGNGDIFTEATTPAGAILCLDARDGTRIWETKLPGGILERPVLDLQNVYCGARDGCCYCLDRATGKERWKHELGSPVIASPAVVFDTDGHTANLFVAAVAGRICCLDPQTGKAQWAYLDLEKKGNAHLSSAPRVVVRTEADGDHRLVYIGATLDGLNTPVLYRLEDCLPR
jgi:outer membrane protein assembly factor BamB